MNEHTCKMRVIDKVPTFICVECGKRMNDGRPATYTTTDEYKTTCHTCGSVQTYAKAWQRDTAAEKHARRCGK